MIFQTFASMARKNTRVGLSVIAVVLLTALPLSVPIFIPSIQVLPLTTLGGIIIFFFLISTGLFRYHSSPLARSVAYFMIYVYAFSVIMVTIDVFISHAPSDRVAAWLRQSVALGAGYTLFLVLRYLLPFISKRTVFISILGGSLLPLSFGLLNVVWTVWDRSVILMAPSIQSFLNSPFSTYLIKQIRFVFVKNPYFYSPDRTSGFSTEPSTYGLLVISIFLPIAILAIHEKRLKILASLCLGGILINLIWTFSVGSLVLFFCFIVLCGVFGPYRKLSYSLLLGAAVAVGVIVPLVPNNHAQDLIGRLGRGEQNESILIRLYGTVEPLLNSANSYALLGYGLGGTASHVTDILPDSLLRDSIIASSWENAPNFKTVASRVWVEFGLIGSILFIMIFISAFKTVLFVSRRQPLPEDKTLNDMSMIALFAVLISFTFLYDSFALPYMWFWLALIDSRLFVTDEARVYNR